MAAPDPYVSTDEYFDPALHWGPDSTGAERTGEKVNNYNPSGEGFYSKNAGEDTLVGIIASKRLRGCLRYVLGYNNMTTTPVYKLQRTNPICHPRMTNLVCTGAAYQEFWPIRNAPAPVGSTNKGLKIPRNDDSTGTVATQEGGPGSTAHTFPYFAGYEKARVTLRFSPAPYRFLSDASTDKEYYRNTIIDTEPRTEVLTLSGFQIIYAEGGGNAAPLTNAKGKVSPGEVGQVLVKPDLVVRWFDVPEKFISKNIVPGQVFPEKIVRGMGTLNNANWLAWRKGTLLLSGARLIRKPWALAAGGNAFDPPPGNVRESMFNYDIELLMTFFDPQKGYHNSALIADATGIGPGTLGADTHGHNCFPYRGEPTGAALAADDKNAGKWFLATYSGLANYIGNAVDAVNPGSRCLFEYSNYDTLFDSVWN